MEAFGRVITVLLAAFCTVFLLFSSKAVSVQWQKNESVRSIVSEYVAELLENGQISVVRQERFVKELAGLGVYEIDLTVFERRRYENETGRVYLYSEWKEDGADKRLLSGSYLKVEVSEKRKGKLETFLYGTGGTVVAGGRVP